MTDQNNKTQPRALAPVHQATSPLDRYAFEPTDRDSLMKACTAMVATNFFSSIRTPEQMAFVIMSGRDLGFSFVQALQTIDVITTEKGGARPSMRAPAQLALVRRSGLCRRIWLSHDPSHPSMEGRERQWAEWSTIRGDDDSGDVIAVGFSLDDARQLGWTDRKQWREQPEQMLIWRALTRLIRREYHSVVLGLYDPDELRDADAPDGAPPRAPASPAAPGASRTERLKAEIMPTAPTVEPAPAPQKAAPESAPAPAADPAPAIEPATQASPAPAEPPTSPPVIQAPAPSSAPAEKPAEKRVRTPVRTPAPAQAPQGAPAPVDEKAKEAETKEATAVRERCNVLTNELVKLVDSEEIGKRLWYWRSEEAAPDGGFRGPGQTKRLRDLQQLKVRVVRAEELLERVKLVKEISDTIADMRELDIGDPEDVAWEDAVEGTKEALQEKLDAYMESIREAARVSEPPPAE